MNLGIIFYPLFKVWPLGQRDSWVCFSRMVLYDVMIFLENLVPVSLLVTQILGFGEVFQILVICRDREWVLGVQKVLALFLESEYDCCHF